jgi:hypothetical protein
MSSMSQRNRNRNLSKFFQKNESQLYKHGEDVLKKHGELNTLQQRLAQANTPGIFTKLAAKTPVIFTKLAENISRRLTRKQENKHEFDSLGTSGIIKFPIVNNTSKLEQERQQKVYARLTDALRLSERVQKKIPQNTQANFDSQANILENGLKDMDLLGRGNENVEELNRMLKEDLDMEIPTISIPTIPTRPTTRRTIPIPTRTTRPIDPNITIKESLHTYLSKLYSDFVILKESLNKIRIIIDPSSEIKKSKEDVKIEKTFSHSNFVECMKTKTFDFLFILKLNYDNLVIKIKKLDIDKEILDIASDKLERDKEKERITKTMLENVLKIENILDKFKKESYDTLIGDYKPVIFNILEYMQAYFAVIDYFIKIAYETGLFTEEQVKILVTNMENLQYFIDNNLLIHNDKRIELHPTFSYFIKSVRGSDLPDFQDDDLDDLNGGRRNPKKKPAKKPTKLNRGADMNMKDIRGLCKVNQIKLSKTKDGVRVIYTKKELITKLRRKKIL